MKTSTKQDKFLSAVIDNFKTPTIAQIKALELFLSISSNKINSDEKDLIELTLNSCNNMQKMLENLSFVSKIGSEKLNLSYKLFNISELVKNIIREANILLKYSNLKLNSSIKPDIESYSDKSKIKKAIENILSYSINSAHKNSTININLNQNQKGLCFEIILNSFSENFEDILQIFEQNKMYNSKNLELFIAKEIINAHFGKIIFKNPKDNILIVGFNLPAK